MCPLPSLGAMIIVAGLIAAPVIVLTQPDPSTPEPSPDAAASAVPPTQPPASLSAAAVTPLHARETGGPLAQGRGNT